MGRVSLGCISSPFLLLSSVFRDPHPPVFLRGRDRDRRLVFGREHDPPTHLRPRIRSFSSSPIACSLLPLSSRACPIVRVSLFAASTIHRSGVLPSRSQTRRPASNSPAACTRSPTSLSSRLRQPTDADQTKLLRTATLPERAVAPAQEGFERNVRAQLRYMGCNSISQIIRISRYSTPSFLMLNCKLDGEKFWLERLDQKDWLAPNEMLKIFSNVRNPELIISAFKKAACRMDYKPSEALYSLLIDRLAYSRKFSYVDDLLERAKYDKCRLSEEFFYRLIKMYGNVANHPDKAIEMLHKMPEFNCWPTVKTFNYVLNMLVDGRHFEVIHELYLSAPQLGVTLDTCCFNILIKGLCLCDKVDSAFSLLHEFPKQGCKPNATTYSTIMHYLCKHKRLTEAFDLYERMQKNGCYPDTITFNILISGLCKQGKVSEGMEMLEVMKLEGCYPNSGTYQVLLYGLLSAEKFVAAKDFIGMMIAEGRKPSFSSYKVSIAGLCRENYLTDAVLVLEQMVHQGFVPPTGTWKMILRCVFS